MGIYKHKRIKHKVIKNAFEHFDPTTNNLSLINGDTESSFILDATGQSCLTLQQVLGLWTLSSPCGGIRLIALFHHCT